MFMKLYLCWREYECASMHTFLFMLIYLPKFTKFTPHNEWCWVAVSAIITLCVVRSKLLRLVWSKLLILVIVAVIIITDLHVSTRSLEAQTLPVEVLVPRRRKESWIKCTQALPLVTGLSSILAGTRYKCGRDRPSKLQGNNSWLQEDSVHHRWMEKARCNLRIHCFSCCDHFARLTVTKKLYMIIWLNWKWNEKRWMHFWFYHRLPNFSLP